MKKILLSIGLILSVGLLNAQDFQMPQASPTAKIHQNFSTSFIDIDYSRPSMKGRAIFGDLVPFDKVWRTGANANTKITFGEDVMVEEQLLQAGTYSLYTIPGKDAWTVIFNKNLENWGTSGYNTEENVLELKVERQEVPFEIETFIIDIDEMTTNSCVISLMWENTYIPIRIKSDNQQRILNYLDKELSGDKPPYYQAASYYYDQNVRLNDAVSLVDKAVKQNPKAFYMYRLKANILAKLGKKEEAIIAATQAVELAKGTPYEAEYAKVIDEIKAK